MYFNNYRLPITPQIKAFWGNRWAPIIIIIYPGVWVWPKTSPTLVLLSFWQVSTLVILGRGSCSELGPTQLAGTEKATPRLRGLSGPAGGADFFEFACQNRDFLLIL